MERLTTLSFNELQAGLVECRQRLQRQAVPRKLLAEILDAAYPGKYPNPRNVIDRVMHDFPYDCCAVASAYTASVLGGVCVGGMYNYIPHVVSYFGTFPGTEMLIGDVTADQFGGPRVYLGNLNLPWHVPSLRAK